MLSETARYVANRGWHCEVFLHNIADSSSRPICAQSVFMEIVDQQVRHMVSGCPFHETKRKIRTTRSLLVQGAGNTPAVPIEVPANPRIGILAFNVKRQLVFRDEPIAS